MRESENSKRILKRYTEAKAYKDLLEKRLNQVESDLEAEKLNRERLTKVHWLFTEAARRTRKEFQARISELVDLVLASVFPDRNFKFELRFEEKRKQVECCPLVIENGEEFNPKDEMGGSTLDIVGLAMRPILWGMERPRSRPLFILDEPARYVGEANIEAVGEVISLLSHKLDIQFILTTHNSALAACGDKSFRIRHDGKQSFVSEASVYEKEKSKKIERVVRD